MNCSKKTWLSLKQFSREHSLQGATIEMQVCTSGWPTPTVKWFKNNEELKSSGPDGPCVVWTDERGIHRCVILNASPKDEAEYALEATNKLGSARTEGAISIIKPRELPKYEEDKFKYVHSKRIVFFEFSIHVFTEANILYVSTKARKFIVKYTVMCVSWI